MLVQLVAVGDLMSLPTCLRYVAITPISSGRTPAPLASRPLTNSTIVDACRGQVAQRPCQAVRSGQELRQRGDSVGQRDAASDHVR